MSVLKSYDTDQSYSSSNIIFISGIIYAIKEAKTNLQDQEIQIELAITRDIDDYFIETISYKL